MSPFISSFFIIISSFFSIMASFFSIMVSFFSIISPFISAAKIEPVTNNALSATKANFFIASPLRKFMMEV